MIVDFYILEQGNEDKTLRFACQRVEQAYQAQQKIYLHVDSYELAERLDKLLWTFRDDSFLPHQIISPDYPDSPIQIGYKDEGPPSSRELMINLAKNIPSFYPQFNRIIEIISSDSTAQQAARERYRQYRDHGFELNTHKMS